MKVRFAPDWSEFVTLLLTHRVRFVLVGGHAFAGHAEPRLTEDLDLFVDPTLANGARLRRALVEFGFGERAPSAEALAVPGKIWMLGRKPWRIDVLTAIDGVTFRDAWRGRVHADFDAGALPVLGLEELIRNKRAAGRPKDLADVVRLEQVAADRRAKRSARPGKVPRALPAGSRRRRRPL
ncbi:MAG: hypothetical protein IT376_08765 [Polyangiaceae bacterium]|nr:hypothetical protein [Polyangiaceae bacterium]